MRKTTAYGRKLARQGRRNELSGVEHAVHAASILKAISTRRSREAPPMPGGECLEDIGRNTARDSELKVRAALESLLHGTETLDRDQDLATLNAALVLGSERMLQILFRTERPRASRCNALCWRARPSTARASAGSSTANGVLTAQAVATWSPASTSIPSCCMTAPPSR